jgi:Leucine-rich repeat (LRR) protein
MNDTPNAIGGSDQQETPIVDSSSSIGPSRGNGAVLAANAPISRGMSNVRGKMQLLGRGDNLQPISPPPSSRRHVSMSRKGYKIRGTVEPPRTSTTSNNAYPTAKMQMGSGRTQTGVDDPAPGDNRVREEMQQSGTEIAEPRDSSLSSTATGESRNNTSDKVMGSKIDSSALQQPGAFRLVPGLPPIAAGDVNIEDETDVTQDETNDLTPARPKRPMVVDATLVEPVPTVELQHAQEADPAELTVGVFRRRAFVLTALVGIIFVASTVAGVTVANNRNTTPLSSQNIAFEQFHSLLSVEYRERVTFDPRSPQGQAYLWLKNDTEGLTMVGWRMLQRYSLSVLYFSWNGNGWFNRSGWLSKTDECSWNPDAASCDASGRISSLQLSENNARGLIPDELSLLTALEIVLIDGNSISGTIPKTMLALSQLARLDLDNNLLVGTLPTELGNITSLESLVVRRNRLNGTLPTEFGMLSLLNSLLIDSNMFRGPLPTTIGWMGKLETLYADFNSLSGSIPTEIGEMSSLTGLALDNNQLTGSIPTEFGRLKRLATINMNRNEDIRGTLPSHLGLLASLQHLYLDRTSLSGTIPSEL